MCKFCARPATKRAILYMGAPQVFVCTSGLILCFKLPCFCPCRSFYPFSYLHRKPERYLFCLRRGLQYYFFSSSLSGALVRFSRATACNGHAELCNRSYGNTTFLTAHNSFGFNSDPLACESYSSLFQHC
jgi:hypothetical protein